MAQIKISELNELETIQDDDLFVVVDESEGETRKAKSKNVRAKNKPLIAVTDEEPTEFNEDDEYYNTDTRLIYKAINSTTWSVEGKVPEEGIMYVVFPEKSTFAWDGSDLISVGGGSGSSDIIIIGDESEATEDTKLIIEEEDMNLDMQGADFLNERSTSTEKGYSASYQNLYNDKIGNMWKLLWTGDFTSGSITVPNIGDYNYFCVVVGGVLCFGNKYYGGGIIGGYTTYTPRVYSYRFNVNGNTISIDSVNKGGSDGTQNVSVTHIYGIM